MCHRAAPHFCGHFDAVARVRRRPYRVNRPGRQILALHGEIELEPSAGEENALFGFDVQPLSSVVGHYSQDFRAALYKLFGRCLVKHLDVAVFHVLSHWIVEGPACGYSVVCPALTADEPGSSGYSGSNIGIGLGTTPSLVSQSLFLFSSFARVLMLSWSVSP